LLDGTGHGALVNYDVRRNAARDFGYAWVVQRSADVLAVNLREGAFERAIVLPPYILDRALCRLLAVALRLSRVLCF
jgi:hypothetical protein